VCPFRSVGDNEVPAAAFAAGGAWQQIGSLVEVLNELVISWAHSPLVLVAVLVLVVIDGVFPPMPSEAVVVALASIGFSTGAPSPVAVVLAAAVGSFLGDNLAFSIGRTVDLSRFRWARGPRILRLLDRARAALDQRSASVILTARFVPAGRVAVNSVAGSTGFSRSRFVLLSAVSGLAWAGYSVLVGVVAGAWLRDQPLLGAAVAVVAALGFGLLIDQLVSRIRRRRGVAVGTAGRAVAGSEVPYRDPRVVQDEPGLIEAELAAEVKGR
jgi:membrane-associated protein